MSLQYDNYLKEHVKNVVKGYNYMRKKMPKWFEFEKEIGTKWSIEKHDASKYLEDEYDAYDAWFYGNQSFENKEKFDRAWLHHIHENPHHWQHWLLVEDDPEKVIISGLEMPFKCIEIPDNYIVEMIADWWSFSWKTDNLLEVFEWYKLHENTIKMHPKSKMKVEQILGELRTVLGKELKSYISE